MVYSWFLINITGQIFFHPKLKRGVTLRIGHLKSDHFRCRVMLMFSQQGAQTRFKPCEGSNTGLNPTQGQQMHLLKSPRTLCPFSPSSVSAVMIQPLFPLMHDNKLLFEKSIRFPVPQHLLSLFRHQLNILCNHLCICVIIRSFCHFCLILLNFVPSATSDLGLNASSAFV